MRVGCWTLGAALGLSASGGLARGAELKPETLKAWESYTAFTEARIASELASSEGFLVLEFLDPASRTECRRLLASDDVCVLPRKTLDDEGREIEVPGGMVHHWYASVLIPNVPLVDVLAWVQSYEQSRDRYAEVEDSRLLDREGDVFHVFLRLRRKKVLTVHFNTEHEVTYRTHASDRASSKSVATRIREIDHASQDNESEKPFGDDRGFLWGLNSYWRFHETEEGTTVECESISLSRNVPAAARWLVKTYLTSVPRESLESTLTPMRDDLAR